MTCFLQECFALGAPALATRALLNDHIHIHEVCAMQGWQLHAHQIR